MQLPKIQLPKKPQYLKLGEDIDFVALFRNIEAKYETCFLLESLGEESDFSRFSVVGFEPDQIISGKLDKLKIQTGEKVEEFQVANPYMSLRDMIPQDNISRGYAGGLVGYLSYDCMNYFEPSLQVKVHDLFEQFKFGVFTDGLVYDKMTGEVFYFYYLKNRIEEIKKLLKEGVKTERNVSVKFQGDTLTQKQHAEIVESVKEDIKAGRIFQCEVGFKSEFEIEGETMLIYEKLRQVNPSPFMYYFKFGKEKIIGASPELVFSLRDGEMETAPLAGTIRRGKNIEEDRQLARELLNDPKEIAEHSMLVDLHRNDMGRVAEFGTVKVRSLMNIIKLSHVQHIKSEVVGIMKRGEDMFSALAANFPMGTVTGSPKIESMKIIDNNEPTARGPYAGGVGHFGFNGDCTFAVCLRTLFMSGKYGYIQTCGGNVYDSEPEKEYQEIQNKLAAMKKVLEEFKV